MATSDPCDHRDTACVPISQTPTVPSLVIRPFTEAEAKAAARWTYGPPYDVYSGAPEDFARFLDVAEDGAGYYAIVDEDESDELVGYCCFGREARVKGQAEEPGTVDVGGGVRPDRTSQGLATLVFPTILEFAGMRFAAERFRTAVAAFNERSTRLCQSAGFKAVRRFDGPGGREFLEFAREV